ncbi:TIGR03985 family CRISPR-associated protein [Spirulina sp. CCNP1310]|uniref:TIGR03985 family CRISPR-associated protein n=1 Tax=Spirulina sp. CCNP1310 TaxID=3110249 RepID=UPI002B1F923A|nr:TIGR03985 family CRISPR-associated protein [Spirulina sp. CCNP1310]MEA5420423.1 TIGR03985 family CRISPR-associated protein [Spirulina sp. CCNP1310]
MEPFNCPPTADFLQTLARVPLAQNLTKAIRLWAWLQILYGENALNLPRAFTLAQWRDRFFAPSHPHSDALPGEHDPACPCQRTVGQWLAGELGIEGADWVEEVSEAVRLERERVAAVLGVKLFAVTRRSLAADLKDLVALGGLQQGAGDYQRVERLPWGEGEGVSLPLVNEDLKAIVDNLWEPLKGQRRFFVEVDYIVPPQALDQVEDWQAALKAMWLETPIPPLRLTYRSARLRRVIRRVVYPICIYYVRRSVYLCTYGESTEPGGQWCNYRLDRLAAMERLRWEDGAIPAFLRTAYEQGALPSPEAIAIAQDQAWGFDFYQPAALMILRFERQFAEGYIHHSDRHATFKPIGYGQIVRLLTQRGEPAAAVARVGALLARRSPQDAYYQAMYRMGDVNVLQRLRAWRPHGEVLYPPALRQQMGQEVAEEYGFYQD